LFQPRVSFVSSQRGTLIQKGIHDDVGKPRSLSFTNEHLRRLCDFSASRWFLCALGALLITEVQIPTEALDRETLCASVECFFCCLLCCRRSRIEAIRNKCVGMDRRSVEAVS
jgi:hypothetical protein